MTGEADPHSCAADVVLVGRLGSRVETRTLPSGDAVTVFTVVVDRPRRVGATGRPVTIDAIACQSFRASVSRRLAGWQPGQWVRAEGRLRRRFWRSGAGLASAMEVDVSRIQRC